MLNSAALTVHDEADGIGVQFYLNENTGQSDNIQFNAGSTVALSAPSQGEDTYGLPTATLVE